jgi:hypothetical protein
MRLSKASNPHLLRSSLIEVPKVEFPPSVMLEVGDILDVLETKGANLALGQAGVCLVVGSCIFYSGAVVANHLAPQDLSAVANVCAQYVEPRPSPLHWIHDGGGLLPPSLTSQLVCARALFGTRY